MKQLLSGESRRTIPTKNKKDKEKRLDWTTSSESSQCSTRATFNIRRSKTGSLSLLARSRRRYGCAFLNGASQLKSWAKAGETHGFLGMPGCFGGSGKARTARGPSGPQHVSAGARPRCIPVRGAVLRRILGAMSFARAMVRQGDRAERKMPPSARDRGS